MLISCKKIADIKIRGLWYLKVYFQKIYVYLRTKFQVSSIIVTSFRQGWGRVGGNFTLFPTIPKGTPKKPKLIIGFILLKIVTDMYL